MNNGWDPKNSLTGNEFLDFLSWCEAVGIDFEEKNQNKDDNEINIDKQQESQKMIKKTKGRDKYE